MGLQEQEGQVVSEEVKKLPAIFGQEIYIEEQLRLKAVVQ